MSFSDGTGHTRTYENGETIFAEGDNGSHLYIVLSGSVTIRKGGDVVSTVMAELGPGEMFGEQALIDRRPHNADAQATGETTLALYDRDTFMASLREDPELALRVLESMSARLRTTTELLQRVCTLHVLDRTELALTQKAILESELA